MADQYQQSLQNAITNCRNFLKDGINPDDHILAMSLHLVLQKLESDIVVAKLQNPVHDIKNDVFTWDELASAIAAVPEDKRKGQVHISIDDETLFRKVKGVEIINDDIYVKNDMDYEDSGTLEQLKEFHGDDFDQTEYFLCTPKGTPFLWDGN